MNISIKKLKQIIKKEIKNKLNERLVTPEERIKSQKIGFLTDNYQSYNDFKSNRRYNFLFSQLRFIFYDDVIEYLNDNFLKQRNDYDKILDKRFLLGNFIPQNKQTFDYLKARLNAQTEKLRKFNLNDLKQIPIDDKMFLLSSIIFFYSFINSHFELFELFVDLYYEAHALFDEDGSLKEIETDNYDTELETKFKNKYENLSSEALEVIKQGNLGNLAININKLDSTTYILTAINPQIAAINIYNNVLEYVTAYPMITLESALDYLESDIDNTRSDILDMYIGMIELSKTKDIDISHRTCYGSWSTNLTAAEKGYGPLMYSIAASWAKKNGGDHNKITSDKRSVKPAARDVWANTFKNRINDFDVYELDDGTKTPDPWDDCKIYYTGKNFQALNYAYEIKNPREHEHFINIYETFLDIITILIRKIINKNVSFEISKDLIRNFIRDTSKKYFSKKYNI